MHIPRVFVISPVAVALEQAAAVMTEARDSVGETLFEVHAFDGVDRARPAIRVRPPDAAVLLMRDVTPERCLAACTALQRDLAPHEAPLALLFPSTDPAVWERIYESGANIFLPWHGDVVQGLPTFVRSLITRWGRPAWSSARRGPVVLDEQRKCADIKNWHAEFTPVQFLILNHLVENKGRLVSQRELADVLTMDFRTGRPGAAAIIYQHIFQIRKKLGPHAGIVRCIRNRGYLLDVSFVAA